MKQKEVYMIYTPEGDCLINTIRDGKSYCISSFIENNNFYANWETARSYGYKCVKVQIVINEL